MKTTRLSWFLWRSCLWVLWAAGSLSTGTILDAAEVGELALSGLAYPGPEGKLIYSPYVNCGDTRELNILPDWSRCGYMEGGVRIPEVPDMVALTPVAGDNRARIQAAIDWVSKLPSDANGFRGAVLLMKGRYPVAGTLRIDASGVVLRGEGQGPAGTVIVDTGQEQDTLIVVAAEGGRISPARAPPSPTPSCRSAPPVSRFPRRVGSL